MSSREFTEWMAYDTLDPIGQERADLRAGIIASTVANTARDEKKHPKPFSADEFMPEFEALRAEKPQQTIEQQIQIAEMLAAAGLGTITRKSDRE